MASSMRLLTACGELRIASACPKCGTPAVDTRGTYRPVTCGLCEYEYATGDTMPTKVPIHLASWATPVVTLDERPLRLRDRLAAWLARR